MPKFRLIDPDVWKHPFFKRQEWYVRDVFLYLFSAAADDEGRFVADPLAIAEDAFPRKHEVEEGQVTEALNALEAGGLVLLYGDGYGFLSGWFEHQQPDKRYREESSLPPPPTSIASWNDAEDARELYKKVNGLRGDTVRTSDVVRWFTKATRELLNRNCTVSAEKLAPSSLGLDSSGVLVVNDLLPEPQAVPAGPADEEPECEQPLAEPEGGSASDDPETPKARPRKAPTATEHAATIAELRKRIPADCHRLVDQYLDAVAEANQTKRISPGRVETLTGELADAADEFNGKPGAFRYGMEAAVRKGAVSVNYVRTVARGHNGQAHFGDMPSTDKPQRQLSDAERQILAIREQQAREASNG